MDEDKVIITKHSIKRTKERVGLSKKQTEKNAQKALKYGLTHAETKAALRRYLDKVYFKKELANNLRVYHHYVYVFRDNKLITILLLPTGLYKLADKLQREKDARREDGA